MVSKTSNVIVSPSVVVVYLYFDSGRNKKKTGIKIPTGNNSVDTLIQQNVSGTEHSLLMV